MCFKKTALNTAYANGLRRCPCCDVQLVWKSNPEKPQKNLATVDHIVPASWGGADHSDNVFVMCRECNNERATECFVKFVSERGVSKSFAENIFKSAHVVSLQKIIANQFVYIGKDHAEILRHNKNKRKQIKKIIKNYVDYFGDYMPEFELLQKLI